MVWFRNTNVSAFELTSYFKVVLDFVKVIVHLIRWGEYSFKYIYIKNIYIVSVQFASNAGNPRMLVTKQRISNPR